MHKLTLILILFFIGCATSDDKYEAYIGQPAKDAGWVYKLADGYSMYPLLLPGDEYLVLDTAYKDLQKGMIVKRKLHGKIVVHKLGSPALRGSWVTYGINRKTNPVADDELMKPYSYLGEVKILK